MADYSSCQDQPSSSIQLQSSLHVGNLTAISDEDEAYLEVAKSNIN